MSGKQDQKETVYGPSNVRKPPVMDRQPIALNEKFNKEFFYAVNLQKVPDSVEEQEFFLQTMKSWLFFDYDDSMFSFTAIVIVVLQACW